MAGMIARDLNHGSPLVQKVAAEWGNFLPTVSKLSTISQNVGYVGAVLDAYKYAGQISEGFSNNPFAGGGYEGLEFAVNALDGAMIGVALGGGPLGAIGALTYGIIRDRLDSDPVLVDVVKTLWDKTGFVGQIADAEVRIMNELLTPLLLEGMIAWDDLTGWEHFGVEDDANIAGYDHVQKMRELWYQKNQELLFALLFQFLPRLDPKKRNYEKFHTCYEAFALVLVAFIAVMMGIALLESFRPGTVSMGRVVSALVGLLFLFVGNLMGKIKPNFFMGIRTPWTISDPDVWNRAHRLGGGLFFLTGLVTLASAVLLPEPVTFGVLMGGTLVTALLPTVMSYLWYRRKQGGGRQDPPEAIHQPKFGQISSNNWNIVLKK